MSLGLLLGSFRSGNADVRLCVSCANFGSWHTCSYELEPLPTLRSTTVIGKNKVILEVRRSWRISQSETFPGEGISVHVLHVHERYTAELRRSFALRKLPIRVEGDSPNWNGVLSINYPCWVFDRFVRISVLKRTLNSAIISFSIVEPIWNLRISPRWS